ncbi:MAG: hypothetical protein AB1352_03415 [Patescibacteria group bacterium]
MGLKTKEPLTERILAKLTELEPMFSMSSGAAMELFGFNDLRKMRRWSAYRRAKAKREQDRIKKAFQNLVKADLVTMVKGKTGQYRLTPKGWIKYALTYSKHFAALTRKPQNQQGGFILIFDIPEQYRHFRDTLRNVLYALGFTQLQKSVFCTYDKRAFEFAGRVVANCELEDRVKFVIAEKIF